MNNRVNEILDSIKYLYDEKPSVAIREANKLLREAKKAKDAEKEACIHFLLSMILFTNGKEEGLLSHAMAAASYFSTTDNYTMIAKTQNLLGIAYGTIEEYQFATFAYKSVLKEVENHGAKFPKDTIYNNLATSYYLLGDTKTAIKTIKGVYRRQDRLKKKNPDLLFSASYNLAIMYESIGEVEKAEYFLELSDKYMSQQARDVDHLLVEVLRIKINLRKENYEAALDCYDKMIEGIQAGEDTYEVHQDYEWICAKLIEIGEHDRADKLANHLWDYAQRINTSIPWIRACRLQAKYFDNVDKPEKAIKYYRQMDKYFQQREKEILKNQLAVVDNTERLENTMEQYKKDLEEKTLRADRDALTGLLNRAALSNIMGAYVEETRICKKSIGCIFFDVDNFKGYNDTYGHVAGDVCLEAIARVCKEVERDKFHFARYGGDEFFGIMMGYSDEEVAGFAAEIAKRIADLNIMHSKNKAKGRVTVSIGCINIEPGKDRNIIDIVNFSDKALYHSKEMGRDCIYMYDSRADEDKGQERFIKID